MTAKKPSKVCQTIFKLNQKTVVRIVQLHVNRVYYCPAIFSDKDRNGKIRDDEDTILNLAPKLKNRFIARQQLYITFKQRVT